MDAILSGQCVECLSACEVRFRHHLHQGDLIWYVVSKCTVCRTRIEVSSYGTPPEALRQAIMKKQGRYGLRITHEPDNLVEMLKLLRDILGLSLKETVRLKPHIPGGVVDTGTQAEMQWLVQVLKAESVAASIVALP